jgi:hypothetical protein
MVAAHTHPPTHPPTHPHTHTPPKKRLPTTTHCPPVPSAGRPTRPGSRAGGPDQSVPQDSDRLGTWRPRPTPTTRTREPPRSGPMRAAPSRAAGARARVRAGPGPAPGPAGRQRLLRAALSCWFSSSRSATRCSSSAILACVAPPSPRRMAHKSVHTTTTQGGREAGRTRGGREAGKEGGRQGCRERGEGGRVGWQRERETEGDSAAVPNWRCGQSAGAGRQGGRQGGRRRCGLTTGWSGRRCGESAGAALW